MQVFAVVCGLLCVLCIAHAAETPPASDKEGNTFSGGLQGLEIAPKVFTNVPYGNSRLSVWGHMDNPKRTPDKQQFFVMPVVMLVPETAECQANVFTKDTLLQFKVVMWNEDIATTVLMHLRKATGNVKLTSLQVTTLPMEQLRLVWANSVAHLSPEFRLNTDWQSYAGQDNVLTFSMLVTPASICETGVKQLKERPDSLGNLELQYVLHGTRASRKQITVSGQHLLQSKTYSQLRNKVDTNGDVYLNSDDLNKLAIEAVSNVVASSTTDADYVDSGDSVSLAKLVYDGLATFTQASDSMTPEMWKSTFWQTEWARPDKLTSYLNKVITKDEGQNHTVHVNDKEEISSDDMYKSCKVKVHSSSGGSDSVGVEGLFSIGGSENSSHETKAHVSEDELRAWLLKKRYDVEWTGEVFKVKSMNLYRLNTQQLGQKQSIAATYVQVHQTQYTYNVQVSIPGESGGVGNGTQTTSAINKRLDGIDAAISKEAADRSAAIAKETADRSAADAKETADRIAADAKDVAARSAEIATANKRTDAAVAVVQANAAANSAFLALLKPHKGQTACYAMNGGSIMTCKAGYNALFCLCTHYDLHVLYHRTGAVTGGTCKCPAYGGDLYDNYQGLCCLVM